MNVVSEYKKYEEEIDQFNPGNKEELEDFRKKYLGNKGLIKQFFADFKSVPVEQKKEYGQVINKIKVAAETKFKEFQSKFESNHTQKNDIDLTAPGFPVVNGSRHPIQLIKNQIIEIFSRIGYAVAEGPEVEDDWHNFTALNTPEDHPARDMQDTFYIADS